jgi:hypothetical protein
MAKPSDWKKLSEEEKHDIGLELLVSFRGQFIISQALSKAMDRMKEVKPPYREESNIEDMEILHETVFPIYQKELMEITPEKFEQMIKKKKEVVE